MHLDLFVDICKIVQYYNILIIEGMQYNAVVCITNITSTYLNITAIFAQNCPSIKGAKSGKVLRGTCCRTCERTTRIETLKDAWGKSHKFPFRQTQVWDLRLESRFKLARLGLAFGGALRWWAFQAQGTAAWGSCRSWSANESALRTRIII